MELVKHETCQQYVARRLSEGWKIVGRHGKYSLILSPPDGSFLRPVDLRNDVETLRPNAPGSYCQISWETGAGCPNHYLNVDEEEPDGDTTNVYENSTGGRDTYNLQDHSVGSGIINFIKVYHVAKRDDVAVPQDCINICIYAGIGTGAPTQLSYSGYLPLLTSYSLVSWTWAENPATEAAWTWDEIDKLQAGMLLREAESGTNYYAYCTQVYVEVDYTPEVGLENKSANMAAKMVAAGLI